MPRTAHVREAQGAGWPSPRPRARTATILRTLLIAPRPRPVRSSRGDVDEDDLGRPSRAEVERLRSVDLHGVARRQRLVADRERALDQVQVAAAILAEGVRDLGAGGKGRDVDRRVLMDLHDVAALWPDHPQEPVGPVLPGELALLQARFQRGRVGQDPELEEPHRLGRRAVPLRMQRARAERHALDATGLELAAVAHRVGVLERALDDVGQAFDVGVRVHRPVGAGDEAVVVEDAERSDAALHRVAVAVEREVPARLEPAALGRVDVGVPPDLEHATTLARRRGASVSRRRTHQTGARRAPARARRRRGLERWNADDLGQLADAVEELERALDHDVGRRRVVLLPRAVGEQVPGARVEEELAARLGDELRRRPRG